MRFKGMSIGAGHVAAFVAGGVVATAMWATAQPSQSRRYRTLDAFAEALSFISRNHVDRVPERRLVYGAIRGMVARLDPHSNFLSPARYKRLRQDTEGEFGGVGIQLGSKPNAAGLPTIQRVVPRSPADRAGVRVNDVLIAVDGRSTAKARSPRRWHSALRGRSGTVVKLRVARAKQVRNVSLVRRRVKLPTVSSYEMSKGIGYVRISKFQDATFNDVQGALVRLRAANAGQLRGLILDLRGNPGGLLNQAISVADLFLQRGLIVRSVGRTSSDNVKQYAQPNDTWRAVAVVVLIDRRTASAAEIVAGALQDHKRAVLVGLRSFGKGSIQTFLDLRDGSGLKLTTARYFRPSGKAVEGHGITPNIKAEAFAPEVITVGPKSGSGQSSPGNSGKRAAISATLARKLADDHQLEVGYQTVSRLVGSKSTNSKSVISNVSKPSVKS